MAKQDTSKTKQILDRNITTHNARDIDGYLANQSPDVEFVLPGDVTLHGRDQVRHYTEALWKAFPDGVLTFGNQVLAEDAAATELVFTGTHTGPMMTPNGPIPPTGKRVTTHSLELPLSSLHAMKKWKWWHRPQAVRLSSPGVNAGANLRDLV